MSAQLGDYVLVLRIQVYGTSPELGSGVVGADGIIRTP